MSVIRFKNNGIRFDLQIIASWIRPGSKVLDLGCGHGNLLEYLKEQKGVKGVGVEKDETKVASCVAKGLSVVHGDINTEVRGYPEASFDYVIVSQTLQQVYEPAEVLKQALRIGNQAIVSFPNFSHWRSRLQLMLKGYAPVTKELPYQWYDTPNIRVITLKDFRRFAREVGFRILKEAAVATSQDHHEGRIIQILPTLRASYGIYLIGKMK